MLPALPALIASDARAMPKEQIEPGRVAYLITSYARPDQVLRLARRLRAGSPGAPLLIHHDDRRSRLDDAALDRLGGVQLVRPPSAVEWGLGSQLDMHVRCFAWALERIAFDWLVLLSEQDYPVRPVADIEHDLLAAPYDAYVEGHPVAPPAWTRGESDEFARRYFYRYRPIRAPGPRLRRALTAARPALALRTMPSGVMLGRRCRTPFSPARPCRRGSDWITLSRAAVAALVGAARSESALREHYRRALVPTESFPHTVLHATPGLRLSPDTRRYTSWSEGVPRPRVLRIGDLERIMASGADFARKFDLAVDRAVLDELDRV